MTRAVVILFGFFLLAGSAGAQELPMLSSSELNGSEVAIAANNPFFKAKSFWSNLQEFFLKTDVERFTLRMQTASEHAGAIRQTQELVEGSVIKARVLDSYLAELEKLTDLSVSDIVFVVNPAFENEAQFDQYRTERIQTHLRFLSELTQENLSVEFAARVAAVIQALEVAFAQLQTAV